MQSPESGGLIVVNGVAVPEPENAQAERLRRIRLIPCTLCGGTNPRCHVCKSLAVKGVEK